jgi:hypothetical protein
MRRQQDILRSIFLDGLALLSICMAILMMSLQVKASKSTHTGLAYVGEGMALCHSDYTPGQDGWITLEFTGFKVSTKNQIVFNLHDGTTVEGNFPCVINLDRQPD